MTSLVFANAPGWIGRQKCWLIDFGEIQVVDKLCKVVGRRFPGFFRVDINGNRAIHKFASVELGMVMSTFVMVAIALRVIH